MELPTVLDLLAIAASAGMSPEQALLEVSRQLGGALGDGLRDVVREAGLGAATHAEGLRALAEREGVPELRLGRRRLAVGAGAGAAAGPGDADPGGDGARPEAGAAPGGGRQEHRAHALPGGGVHLPGVPGGASLPRRGGAARPRRLNGRSKRQAEGRR